MHQLDSTAAIAAIAGNLSLPSALVKAPDTLDPDLFLKMECWLPTRSFKVRPALWGILAQLEAARERGIVTSSSGNFAQAVAWAARRLNVCAKIIVMSNTSPLKIERTREFGGDQVDVILCPPTFEARWQTTYAVQAETNAVLLHPYDSLETITADSTVGVELLQDFADSLATPTTVIVPASGGGLLAGIASALYSHRPHWQVVGVQPQNNGSLEKSFRTHQRVTVPAFQTLADALIAVTPGEQTFPIIEARVADVMSVSESEIVTSLTKLAETLGLVVEPAAACTLAVARRLRDLGRTERLVCIMSGANISLEEWSRLVAPTSRS